MKKLLLLCLLIGITISGKSQNKIELTTNGFKSIDNKESNYLVFESKGTQLELYGKIKSFINSRFVSPKDVISENSPNSITLNGVKQGISIKKALGYIDFSINYTIVFYFKDDKIRIDLPRINKMTGLSSSTMWQLTINQYDGTISSNYDRMYIFNSKGDLKNQSAKLALENYFNSFINDAINYKVPNNENW